MRYELLFRITKIAPMRSCAAVHSAWQVYIALPSPIIAMTGRSGNASLTPIAAGRPQPMPPPRRPKKLLESSHRSEEHTSELQSHSDLVCRLLLEKKNKKV